MELGKGYKWNFCGSTRKLSLSWQEMKSLYTPPDFALALRQASQLSAVCAALLYSSCLPILIFGRIFEQKHPILFRLSRVWSTTTRGFPWEFQRRVCFVARLVRHFPIFPTESISQTACPTRIFHSFNYSTSPPESLFKKKDHVTQQNLLVFSVQKRSKSLNHQAVVFSINKNIDELRNLILAVRLLAMYWTSKFELLRGCSVPKRFSHVLALSATQWVQERVIFDLHPTFGSERMNVLII